MAGVTGVTGKTGETGETGETRILFSLFFLSFLSGALRPLSVVGSRSKTREAHRLKVGLSGFRLFFSTLQRV